MRDENFLRERQRTTKLLARSRLRNPHAFIEPLDGFQFFWSNHHTFIIAYRAERFLPAYPDCPLAQRGLSLAGARDPSARIPRPQAEGRDALGRGPATQLLAPAGSSDKVAVL